MAAVPAFFTYQPARADDVDPTAACHDMYGPQGGGNTEQGGEGQPTYLVCALTTLPNLPPTEVVTWLTVYSGVPGYPYQQSNGNFYYGDFRCTSYTLWEGEGYSGNNIFYTGCVRPPTSS